MCSVTERNGQTGKHAPTYRAIGSAEVVFRPLLAARISRLGLGSLLPPWLIALPDPALEFGPVVGGEVPGFAAF
jgi:hypothetical protein